VRSVSPDRTRPSVPSHRHKWRQYPNTNTDSNVFEYGDANANTGSNEYGYADCYSNGNCHRESYTNNHADCDSNSHAKAYSNPEKCSDT
jgi:hypothetical protein